MRRFGIFALFFLALFACICLFVIFGLPRIVITPPFLEKHLIEPLEQSLQGAVNLNDYEIRYTPQFQIVFSDVDLHRVHGGQWDLSARKIIINPNPVALIVGRFMVKSIAVEDGQFSYEESKNSFLKRIEVEHMMIMVKPFEKRQPIHIEFSGDLAGERNAVSGSGRLVLKHFDEWSWQDTDFSAKVNFSAIPLKFFQEQNLGSLNYTFKQGLIGGGVEIVKKSGSPETLLSGTFDLNDAVYENSESENPVASPVFNASLDYQLNWNVETEAWALRRARAVLPFAFVELSGQGALSTGEIQDMRITLSEIKLDEIPTYFTDLKENIPLNTGFSGKAAIEISLKGTLHHLSAYSSMDLKDAVFTYARFFDKPKDFPLTVNMDCLIENLSKITGDFSWRFQDVLGKGNVKDLNFKTKTLQINMITNKHSVTNWKPVMPALKDYDASGAIKILYNWKGSWQNIQDAEKVLNITLDDGNLTHLPDGLELKGIGLVLDYDRRMGLVIKNSQLEMNGIPLKLDLSIYNLNQNPISKIALASSQLDLSYTLNTLQAWSGQMPQALSDGFAALKKLLEKSGAEKAVLNNFLAEMQYDDQSKVWKIDRLSWDAYEGKVSVDGEIRAGEPNPSYRFSSEMNHLQIERLFPSGQGPKARKNKGELFVKMTLEGEYQKDADLFESAQGGGTFLVSDAKFSGFDLMNLFSKINELKDLSKYKKNYTEFDDIRGSFTTAQGKFLSDDMILVSPDFVIEGKGELTTQGFFNMRFETYLSDRHTEEIIGTSLNEIRLREGLQFGPLTVVFTGTLQKPDMQVDPVLTNELFGKLHGNKPQAAFRNFLREEVFFERPAKA